MNAMTPTRRLQLQWKRDPEVAVAQWLTSSEFPTARNGLVKPLRPSSAAVYKSMAGNFIRKVLRPGKSWKAVTKKDIEDFLKEGKHQSGIWNRYVRLLERLFDHLTEVGVVTANPARGLAVATAKDQKPKDNRTVWLTEVQIEKIIDALPPASQGWKAHRNRAMAAAILGGGFKVSEVVRLREDMVGPMQSDGSLQIDVPPVGAGRHHTARLARFAAKILRDWLATKALLGIGGDLIFPSKRAGGQMHGSTVYLHIAGIFQAAGLDERVIEHRGARTLRTSYALNEIKGGTNAEVVGEWLGLRAERSTRRYVALAGSSNRAGPRATKRPTAPK